MNIKEIALVLGLLAGTLIFLILISMMALWVLA